MNIVIIEPNSQAIKILKKSLLQEGGFDSLEAFSNEDQASKEAHWEDTEILLTASNLCTAAGKNLLRWVHKNYPDIATQTHALQANNEIIYS